MRAASSRSMAAVLLLLALAPGRAHADPATEAKVRFDRGLEHYRHARVRAALDEFLVSNRLSPNPSAAFNIGRCFELLGKRNEAFSALSEYLDHELSPEERAEGERAMQRILGRIARLQVLTTPPGAAVFLDRRNLGTYGTTPRTLAAAPGEHEVILTLDGHHAARRRVALRTGELVRLEVPLAPLTGRLRLITRPSDAEVRRNDARGDLLGTTPLVARLPAGPHLLHASLTGHEPVRREVTVRAEDTTHEEWRLEPLPPPTGSLRVVTNTGGALVRLGGTEVGFSPLVVELPPGSHPLRVDKPGFLGWAASYTVERDHVTAVDVVLAPAVQETGRGPWPWVLAGTTAVATTVAAALGGAALWTHSRFESEGRRDLFDRTRTLNQAADVMLALSVLGATATSVLYLTVEDVQERDSEATARRFHVDQGSP